MYILSAGYAYPETVISNAFLAELSPQHPALYIGDSTGIRERRSVMKPDYLRASGNQDVGQSVGGSVETPTDLGVRACEMALQRAGIERDAVGFILGDGSAPVEIVPAEAQRIACRLGLKVMSYDTPGLSAALPLVCHTLSSWKDEALPEYILFVSVNTPTQRINYRQGSEGLYFGDGAGAVLLSSRKAGRCRLIKSFFGSDSQRRDLMVVDVQAHLKCANRAIPEVGRTDDEMLQRAIEETNSPRAKVRWISGRLEPLSLKESAARRGLSVDQVWSTLDRLGNMLGSTGLTVLAERWEKAQTGDRIIVTGAGFGFNFGYAVFEVM